MPYFGSSDLANKIIRFLLITIGTTLIIVMVMYLAIYFGLTTDTVNLNNNPCIECELEYIFKVYGPVTFIIIFTITALVNCCVTFNADCYYEEEI